MNVLFSFLGVVHDCRKNKQGEDNIWRPSLAVLNNTSGLHFDQYHIVWQSRHRETASEILTDLRAIARDTKIIDHELSIEDPWDLEEVYGKIFDLASDLKFDSGRDEHYIHIATGTHATQISLFLLNESHHLPGKLLQSKPFPEDKSKSSLRVIDLDLARYDKIASRFETQKHSDITFLKSGIQTKNREFNEQIETIEKVALSSKEPILLTGPTGAGKSQLAKKIFELKKEKKQLTGNFVDINCATLRGDQAMSTLFGHKKGSFTGAVTDRPGLLKAADKGMLFLDEIGELGLDEQAMLLRAVEEKVFLPLGADTETNSSFELICGTNRDLRKEVREGRFRGDLLERINLWSFRLPGLADRREDIAPNVDYELENFQKKNGKRITFNAEALQLFMDYALDRNTRWEGNFRELNSIITRLATLAPAGRIDENTVKKELLRCRREQEPETSPNAPAVPLPENFNKLFDPFDLVQLQYTVGVCRSSKNISEAGKKLFSVSRTRRKTVNDTDRLTKYLAKFDLTFDQVCRDDWI